MNHIYVKLNHDTMFFNKLCMTIKKEDLSYGEYRVILHVKGLYIGIHGQGPKLASLQFRICQVQFNPIAIQCLFNAPTLPPQNMAAMNPPETPQPGQTKKLTRRPKLQRQNAVIETKAQEMETMRPMGQFPGDSLFSDLDFGDSNN